MNLNGWQRIGVVVSALWAVAAVIYERGAQMRSATLFHEGALRLCMPEFAKTCTDAADETFSMMLSLHSIALANIAAMAIGPVLAGWAFAYLIVKIWRWVKAGF